MAPLVPTPRVMKKLTHPEGPALSRILAGVWRWHTVSSEAMERLIYLAIDQGITSFDHADIYGNYSNEELFGRVLKRNPSLLRQIQLVSKCGICLQSDKRPEHRVKHYNTSQKHILASVENSLRELGADHLDVLLLHRPDPLMNVAEVCEAFMQLKQQGKVSFFGVSNFTPAQFDLLQSVLPFPLVTNQIEISLAHPVPFTDGTMDHLYRNKVSAMAWSPLGGGHMNLDERLFFSLAARYNATYSQLALAWLLHHPSQIFPIIGTTQPDRITEAAKAVDIVLEKQDWFEMLKWSTGKEVA